MPGIDLKKPEQKKSQDANYHFILPEKTALFFPFLPSHRFIYRCIVGEMNLSCFGFWFRRFGVQ